MSLIIIILQINTTFSLLLTTEKMYTSVLKFLCSLIINIVIVQCNSEYVTFTIYPRLKPKYSILAKSVNTEKDAQKITVEYQDLPVLSRGYFTNLPYLEKIDLQGNGINVLEATPFLNLPSLSSINLSNNSLTAIQFGVFSRLPIKTLLLHRNMIQTIDKYAFYNLNQLEVLDLSENNILFLETDNFFNVTKLVALNLSNNYLHTLPQAFIEGLFFNTINDYGNYINLNNNKFTYIDKYMLKGASVKSLYLSYNLINEIHPNAFENLTSLSALKLDGNNLQSICDDVLEDLLNIEHVSLIRNPWTNTFACEYQMICKKYEKNENIDVECDVKNFLENLL